MEWEIERERERLHMCARTRRLVPNTSFNRDASLLSETHERSPIDHLEPTDSPLVIITQSSASLGPRRCPSRGRPWTISKSIRHSRSELIHAEPLFQQRRLALREMPRS